MNNNGNNRRTGKCKWFSDEKGFGFIIDDETQTEVFVHHYNVTMDGRRVLFPNELVEFEYGKDERGRTEAKAVVRLKPESHAVAE